MYKMIDSNFTTTNILKINVVYINKIPIYECIHHKSSPIFLLDADQTIN